MVTVDEPSSMCTAYEFELFDVTWRCARYGHAHTPRKPRQHRAQGLRTREGIGGTQLDRPAPLDHARENPWTPVHATINQDERFFRQSVRQGHRFLIAADDDTDWAAEFGARGLTNAVCIRA